MMTTHCGSRVVSLQKTLLPSGACVRIHCNAIQKSFNGTTIHMAARSGSFRLAAASSESAPSLVSKALTEKAATMASVKKYLLSIGRSIDIDDETDIGTNDACMFVY
jgi:hypothetical protein